jgi:hypothetical protein
MNLFHGGRLAAMPPKLNDEGDVMVLGRSLLRRIDLEKFAASCGSDRLRFAAARKAQRHEGDAIESACPAARHDDPRLSNAGPSARQKFDSPP